MGKYIDYYLKHDGEKLKYTVNQILKTKFAWLPMIYYDDVYSIASVVVWHCEQKYNENKNTKFNTWFRFCLERKIKTYITYFNRDKRGLKGEDGERISDVYLDAPINEDGDCLRDMIADKPNDECYDMQRVNEYVATLSNDAKKVLRLLVKGYKNNEISKMLGYSEKKVSELIKFMRSERRIKILRR